MRVYIRTEKEEQKKNDLGLDILIIPVVNGAVVGPTVKHIPIVFAPNLNSVSFCLADIEILRNEQRCRFREKDVFEEVPYTDQRG